VASKTSGAGRLLLLFGAVSFVAVGAGALATAASGTPSALWARNLAAWMVGALAALAVSRAGPRLLPFFLLAAPIALGATFFSPGQAGVHRWVSAGPLSLNAAMLLLPAAATALAASGGTARWPWTPAFVCLGLLALQPDASQATAFGAAMVLIAALGAARTAAKGALIAAAGAAVAIAWLRPDPLQPVPEVEGIVELAAGVSPALAGLMLATLAAVALAPVLGARPAPREVRIAGAALGLYLALCVVTTFLGAFPVPLAGIGVSPILGSWLAVGLLAALTGSGASASSPTAA
jgi:cell division protein FtsW (lipid II flippase)